MKITIFYGSIHKTRGNTYVIINEFAEGAKEAGAKVEVVLLAEKEINHCITCVKCWTKTPGRCALKDDMAGLLKIFMQSDLVVMATPVYIHNVTGIMKTFLDRMMPIIDPHQVKMENGYTGHIKKFDEYKQNVRMAAKEVVENMKISEVTAQKLDQPFIPEEMYIEQVNKYWDSRIAHYKENKE